MLNATEREEYVIGGAVRKLAKPLVNLFDKDASEDAIENVMKQAHDAVEEAPTGMKRSDVFKQVAEDQDLTVKNVKDIEKVFAYRAGGGGKENILGEVKQVIRAMTIKPTSGQADAENFAGTRTTREARKKAGEAFIGGTLLGGGAIGAAWAMQNKGEPPSEFEKAFSKAFNEGKETFTFKGKKYTTEVRKGKNIGGEMESSATARTREAAIEKDERERRERMIKAEAKRLNISEERLKEILLEREQEEMDRKMQEASERQSRAPLLVGGQTKLDANKDGDITGEDFAMLRDRKAEGSEVDEGTVFRNRYNELMQQGMPKHRALKQARREQDKRKFARMSKEEKDKMFSNVEESPIARQIRENKAEGSMLMPVEGMPVDTYPNIPEDEMDEALASQLPDDEMEDDYISYVMDESLSDSEQDYLAGVLQQDDRLSDILDKVITTASEFSGAGKVAGPGTGVSDSIPARLSDGEFVFTKKATDQIGADALQRMMDDAERAYDGGLQAMANGGMMEDEDPENPGMSKTKEEIEKLMMGANRMPSLR